MTLKELTEKIVYTPSLADKYGKVESPNVVIQIGYGQYDIDSCYTTGNNDLVLVAKDVNDR